MLSVVEAYKISLYTRLKTMSLRGTKQSHVEKRSCKVRDCFAPRNDNQEDEIVYRLINSKPPFGANRIIVDGFLISMLC